MRIFSLEGEVEDFLEVGEFPIKCGEGRRAFIGLEERDKFGGEAERAGEGGLGVRKKRDDLTSYLCLPH
jgi:hypothetical protein